MLAQGSGVSTQVIDPFLRLETVKARTFSLIVMLTISGCSAFKAVEDVSELGPERRVMIGELRYIGTEPDFWVGIDQRMILTYAAPTDLSKVTVTGGDRLSGHRFGPSGGVFRIGADNRPVFILGISLGKTIITTRVESLFPLLIQSSPSGSQCEYIGTIVVTKGAKGEKDTVEIQDHFAKYRDKYASLTKGCKLVRNIATKLKLEDFK